MCLDSNLRLITSATAEKGSDCVNDEALLYWPRVRAPEWRLLAVVRRHLQTDCYGCSAWRPDKKVQLGPEEGRLLEFEMLKERK